MFQEHLWLLTQPANPLTPEMMYSHMALSPMDWSSLTWVGVAISLSCYWSLYYLLTPASSNPFARWNNLLNKVAGSDLPSSNKSYMIVAWASTIILLNNLYSIFSFNWMPSAQPWVMLTLTTVYLVSTWSNMVLTAGTKLFGHKIPISWYLINLFLWLFHNLSFFIRFVSLPFRMMMNLMVGCFLMEFGKFNYSTSCLISLYETFVVTVQTLVFILLMNMYYSEMTMTPEWKSNSTSFAFLPQLLKIKPICRLLKTKLIFLGLNSNSLFSLLKK
uniref:ATP synthase F0 subunit 6 n=1 Tax=Trichuris sp. GHL-2013 TaxID=1305677 RepID=S4U1G3_9BILA|nr:ATP synthase F0 subunit 6 [Trichuris sp. GHL-2013]